MIIVKPNGGLGNRMRVINSAICLAERNNHAQVKLLWKRDPGMNAAFSDIFKPITKISVIENKLIMGCYFYSRKLNRIGYKYYNDESVFFNQFKDEHWNKNHSKVILNTCIDFYELHPQTNFYNLLVPVEKLLKRINQMASEWRDEVVGVHIRRTDNVPAANYSKTIDFISRMDQIIKNKPYTKFYLSTDDTEIEMSLKHRFGNELIIIDNKNLSRNIKSGIEDAVIDMYCLSRTRLILGSYSSSFSAVASAIGRIPLEIISQK